MQACVWRPRPEFPRRALHMSRQQKLQLGLLGA
jgi:hypothetical protein